MVRIRYLLHGTCLHLWQIYDSEIVPFFGKIGESRAATIQCTHATLSSMSGFLENFLIFSAVKLYRKDNWMGEGVTWVQMKVTARSRYTCP